MSRRRSRQLSRLSCVPLLLGCGIDSMLPTLPVPAVMGAVCGGTCKGAGRHMSSGLPRRTPLPLPEPEAGAVSLVPKAAGVRPANAAAAPGVKAPSEMSGDSAGAHLPPMRPRPTGVPLTVVAGNMPALQPPLLRCRLCTGWLGVRARF